MTSVIVNDLATAAARSSSVTLEVLGIVSLFNFHAQVVGIEPDFSSFGGCFTALAHLHWLARVRVRDCSPASRLYSRLREEFTSARISGSPRSVTGGFPCDIHALREHA